MPPKKRQGETSEKAAKGNQFMVLEHNQELR